MLVIKCENNLNIICNKKEFFHVKKSLIKLPFFLFNGNKLSFSTRYNPFSYAFSKILEDSSFWEIFTIYLSFQFFLT